MHIIRTVMPAFYLEIPSNQRFSAEARNLQTLPIWTAGMMPCLALTRSVFGWIRKSLAASATSSKGSNSILLWTCGALLLAPSVVGHGASRRAPHVQSNIEFEPLLDVAEAARLLRIHPKTLRVKARHGIIPAVQIGRVWRFRASALNRWLEGISR